jgi:transcriptional regulator with XRE-family HTH domain
VAQDCGMPASTRQLDEAGRRTRRQVAEIGAELRERRLILDHSQDHVAAAAGISRRHYGRIERGRVQTLSVLDLNRVGAVLGLQASVRLYPDGVPVRDVAHASRLRRFLEAVRPPLTYRLEVALPAVEGRPERRAWDAVIFRGRERCAVELEMRLRDVQALLRRIDLKRRDDPTEAFILLVADTRTNRRVLAEFEALFESLPRLRSGRVADALREGRLPPTGLLML